MRQFTFLMVATMLFSIAALGQKGIEDGSKYGHGDDSIRCIKNLSLYREYAKNKNYGMALPFWQIVFAECPKSSKNIYIDGAKMYGDLIEDKQNEARKDGLIDTLMLIYDQRVEHFKEKGYVLGRKGVDLLRYAGDNIGRLEQGYNTLADAIKYDKDPSESVLMAYFSASIALMKANKLDAAKVVEDYATLASKIDEMLAKKTDAKTCFC
ncbi:MAG: hypothetical protein HC896_10320 [Bacteroidales bacterium]|nr:hypothetical protein [Bacteroidales bacterium]